ncbi:hypothetical protein P8947_12150 [Enterococcus faecium]|uniref:hypothetical protein n=1 Tax=Enterococcus faecium TaxID=1352 RepID=UPI0024154425|nr:hypothetical protein [Enterococcus faecium]MDG4568446.1 hypothetical protein [Enterococcus faecium]
MIEEKKKVLYSNKPEFKKLVMQYAKKNIGRSITYDTFIKWLDKYGYDLSQYDTCCQAVFKSLLQRNFQIDIAYRKTKECQLITVFQLNKS